MKATGIVRRIDELGRIVIPKEIRRTMRLREGDPLEIFTDREGCIILKKYSAIGELNDFSRQYAESINTSIGHIVVICDRDTIIAVSGAVKKEYFEKSVSNELEKIMNARKTYNLNDNHNKSIPIYDDENVEEKYSAQVIVPIIADGDLLGAVLILSKETGITFGQAEAKLSETAALFLAKQME